MFLIAIKTIIFIFIVSCYSSLVLPIDEKNISYTRIYYNSNKKTTTQLPGSSKVIAKSSPGNKPTPPIKRITEFTPQLKIRQAARFTKKQYEIINMFWRKTKIYLEVEATSSPKPKYDNLTKTIFDLNEESNSFIFSPDSKLSQSSTPSYIEFYYSDEANDQVTAKDCVNGKCQLKADKHNANLLTHNSSFVIFRIKPLPKTGETHTKAPIKSQNFFDNQSKSTLSVNDEKSYTKILKINEPVKPVNISKRCMAEPSIQPTTEYDKIKFFELYDQLTPTPAPIKYSNKGSVDKGSQINNEHTRITLLEQVDQTYTHKKPRHAKKHITDNYKNQGTPCYNNNDTYKKPKPLTMNVITEEQNKTDTYTTILSPIKFTSIEYQTAYPYKNRSVSWSEYPYAAVYVYEPLQVHCDAVSISEHWLIASGSCLSRLTKNLMLGGGRSAFVAYCGDRWWVPERVSYVKFSGVHPWYHPKDRTRKHLYNIGVIQVVTSMSACSEWAPVSLMSHQFTANRGGSEAIALGWGLDRFDTRYTSLDLPKMSLMIYKGLVFSDSCPGNTGYGKMKQFDDGGGVSNVYCLSLPPYYGEDSDPVHGSLLLIDGKLMALYLQEERRPSGEQSAQYTGIWRLIPWVMEMAKEPLDAEPVEI